MKITIKNVTSTLILSLVIIGISGCAGLQTRTRSSVVDYLYPKDTETVVQPSMPVLNVPTKVGIAFVPEQFKTTSGSNFWSGNQYSLNNALTEKEKIDLLDKVAEYFRKYEFVSEIEVIPSAYLTPAGSFANIDQIKTMYGIDVIALVSYDQVQFTDEGLLSLTYWTLIGAYVVSGEKNDTSTMLDTAVYDIASRKMLFRAPGTSNVKGSATPVNLSEELRVDSRKGFDEATDKMVQNLDTQLLQFQKKVKERTESVKVVYREGYSGGTFRIWELAFLLLTLFLVRKRNHSLSNK